MQPVVGYIALGANLGSRKYNILRALELLRQTRGVGVRQVSTLINTRAIAPGAQRDYLNAVAEIQTTLEPLDLLNRLQEIEACLGRVRTARWQPRTIDLDLLLYGKQTIRSPRLTVPHREIKNRGFVQAALQQLGVRV